MFPQLYFFLQSVYYTIIFPISLAFPYHSIQFTLTYIKQIDLEIIMLAFHAKMGSIKDRNGMDLTEAEDIMKRWQEYTEELYKK